MSLNKNIYKLIEHWSSWSEYGEYYLNELLPVLKKDFNKGTEDEKSLLENIKKEATNEEWDNLADLIIEIKEKAAKKDEILVKFNELVEQGNFEKIKDYYKENCEFIPEERYNKLKLRYVETVKDQIAAALAEFDYKKAEREYIRIKDLSTDYDYKGLVSATKKKEIDAAIEKVKNYLLLYKYNKAEEIYSKIKGQCPDFDYDYHVSEAKEDEIKNEKKKEIITKLDNHEFLAADKLHHKLGVYTKEDYEEVKTISIQDYLDKELAEKIKINLDLEKANAISHLDKNLLLRARAGSGKTTTIAYKTFYLLNKENIKSDELMILAFNKKAAREIKDKIKKDFGLSDFENARTFHSLAYQLVLPEGSILFDDNRDFAPKKFSEYVQKILKNALDSDARLRNGLYMYFRKAMKVPERDDASMSREKYYLFRRNLRETTLNAELVKSKGEKYIADFLFEHGLSYRYEKINRWDDRNYKPDFTIWDNYSQREIIIEHWGIYIRDFNRNATLDDPAIEDYNKYYESLKRKRQYWKQRKIFLVETSMDDMSGSREEFEEILKEKLSKAGLYVKKLPLEERIKKVIEAYSIIKMTDLITQYIQKAQKAELSHEDMRDKIEKGEFDEKTEIFLRIANNIYRKYVEKKKQDNKIDFDELMSLAIQKIHDAKGMCDIDLEPGNNRKVRLDKLKWIMIDEYQDFSKLFLDLIQAICRYNDQVRLFCVGDDWQAINGFAGSDLEYFNNFSSYISESVSSDLLTNYRSARSIVENGNRFMSGRGNPSLPFFGAQHGEVSVKFVEEVKIEFKKDEDEYDDKKFIFMKNDNVDDWGFIKAKYLKLCHGIIHENLGKSVAMLFRKNKFYYIDIKRFYAKLKDCFTKDEIKKIGDYENKIKCGTAHSFKGLEADIVIVMEAQNGNFPLVHADNKLFEIFGQNDEWVLDEETRLFYVAITRPKERLFLAAERGVDGDAGHDFVNRCGFFT